MPSFLLSKKCKWYNRLIMKWRLIYNVLIFLSLTLVTWPVYTALLLAGVFIFSSFYEALLWLLIIEILFGPIGVGLFGHYYLLLVSGALLSAVLVKKTMRYYE